MGDRVAVLLCGYGEVEEYDEFADYNERSFRLLVSKSIKFPDFSIPFLSRRLERAQKKEWHAANHYHSPHNDIFERQRTGIDPADVAMLVFAPLFDAFFGGQGVSEYDALTHDDSLSNDEQLHSPSRT